MSIIQQEVTATMGVVVTDSDRLATHWIDTQ